MCVGGIPINEDPSFIYIFSQRVVLDKSSIRIQIRLFFLLQNSFPFAQNQLNNISCVRKYESPCLFRLVAASGLFAAGLVVRLCACVLFDELKFNYPQRKHYIL